MIRIKHLMDSVDNEDGPRLFVDRSGLTRDLTEWCAVDHVLANVAPPKALVRWFERHPSEYAHFRAMYHDFLRKSRYRPSLGELAGALDQAHYLDDAFHPFKITRRRLQRAEQINRNGACRKFAFGRAHVAAQLPHPRFAVALGDVAGQEDQLPAAHEGQVGGGRCGHSRQGDAEFGQSGCDAHVEVSGW